MADQEKWELRREEIEARLRKQNQENDAKGKTCGGRSSGQGVKLLYIRDYLYHHATKEHPQNATKIKKFLALHNIKASEKTIYNDIVRLRDDFAVPVEYNASKWGYYITKPEFEPHELRLMVDSIQVYHSKGSHHHQPEDHQIGGCLYKGQPNPPRLCCGPCAEQE